nr:hypothetical protein HmN_000371700 [Hymenolepis microstoma]
MKWLTASSKHSGNELMIVLKAGRAQQLFVKSEDLVKEVKKGIKPQSTSLFYYGEMTFMEALSGDSVAKLLSPAPEIPKL